MDHHVDGLALIDVLLTSCGLDNDLLLRDLAEGLEDLFLEIAEEGQVLDRTTLDEDRVPGLASILSMLLKNSLQVWIPVRELTLRQVLHEVIRVEWLDRRRDLTKDKAG